MMEEKPDRKLVLLKDESETVLSMLSSCDDSSIVDSIVEIIGDTTAAIHKPIYVEAQRFYKDHHRFPDYAYFLKTFPQMNLSAVFEGAFSLDVITDFLLFLRQEVVNHEATQALIDRDYPAVIECCSTIIGSQKKLTHYGVDDAIAEYEEMASRNSSGVDSGIKEIDDIVNGFSYGTMTVIAAPPSMFKTTLAQNIAYNAITKGKKVAFISLELQKKNIFFNLLSLHSFFLGHPVPAERIHKALLAIGEKKTETITEEPKLGIFRKIARNFQKKKLDKNIFVISPNDIPSWEPAYLTKMLENVDEHMGGLDVVFLDYIQICRSFSTNTFQSTDFVNNLISHLTLLSKTYHRKGFVLFLLSQVNRESIKMMDKTEGDKGMSLASFAEFHALERDAHFGILIFAGATDKIGGHLQLKLIKNRTGATHEHPVAISVSLPFGVVGFDKPSEGVSLEEVVELTQNSPEYFTNRDLTASDNIDDSSNFSSTYNSTGGRTID